MQIKRLGLESRIHIVNEFVSFEIARDYFSASDIVVQPYRTATQSGVTPLAYHFEVPLVTTDLKGLKTPILKDGTGAICSQTPKLIAAAIKKLLISENLNLAKKNIRKTKSKYSWRSFVVQWIDFVKA
jgi:glycosyltransferase involved in cell wall biosynthesis